MVVANGAPGGQAHPDGEGGFCPVHRVPKEPFFRDGTAFAGGDVAAVEAAGNALVAGGVGQQVPGKLPSGELVKGKVVVEGTDHPVAVGPHAALVVEVQAVSVRITGGIEPGARHVFAIARGRQESVHDALVSAGRAVGEKGIHFRGCGRKPGKVQR